MRGRSQPSASRVPRHSALSAPGAAFAATARANAANERFVVLFTDVGIAGRGCAAAVAAARVGQHDGGERPHRPLQTTCHVLLLLHWYCPFELQPLFSGA